MVGEFPELQGSIGGYLLRNKNYDEIVYKAVQEHYHPKHADDNAYYHYFSNLALSDKLKAYLSFFLLALSLLEIKTHLDCDELLLE